MITSITAYAARLLTSIASDDLSSTKNMKSGSVVNGSKKYFLMWLLSAGHIDANRYGMRGRRSKSIEHSKNETTMMS